MIELERDYTVEEAAVWLTENWRPRKASSVYRYIVNGKIAARRVAGQRYIRESELRAFVAGEPLESPAEE